jgi:hypothetical protein
LQQQATARITRRTAVFDVNEHAVKETFDEPISIAPPPLEVAIFVVKEHEVSATFGQFFIPNAPPDPDLFEVNVHESSVAIDE